MKITSRMKSKLFSIFSHKILFCGILLIFSLCNLFCAEYVWTGGGVEGKWDDPANWDGSGYPGGSDNATFSSGAEVTITSNITVNQIYLNAGSKVTCDSNVTISLNSIITQGEFLNKGTLQKRENVSFIIKVEAGGKLINENKIICTDIEGLGNSNITNNGTIEASGAATFQSGANFTNADTSELSIGGAMRNEGAFTNSGGTVTVKGTTTNTGTITNSGDFTSEGAITNNAGGTVTNSGGTITGTITNSGTVTNNGGTISGTVTGNEVVGGGSTEPKSYSSKPSSNTLNWNDPATWENGKIPDISGDTAVAITLNADVSIEDFQAFFSEGNEKITLNGTGNLLYNEKKIYISQKSDTELDWNIAENWINGIVPIITGEERQEVVIVLNSDFTSSETLVFNSDTGAAIHIYLCNKKLSADSVQLVSDWTHPQNNPAGNIHFYGSGTVEIKSLDASNNTNRTSTHRISLYDETIFKITEHAYADPARGEIIDTTGNCEVYLPASGFDMRVPSGKNDGATFVVVGTKAKAIEPQSYYKIEVTTDISETEKNFTFSRSEAGKHNYDLNFPYVVYLMGDASWKLDDTELTDGFEGNVTIPKDNIENGTSQIEKSISLSSGTVESGDGIKVVFYTPCKNLVLKEFIYEKEIIYWTGDVNEDFLTPSNWSLSGTPLVSLDELTGKTVKIPSNCTNYPKLSSDISLEKLVVEDGAEVTILDNGKLTVEKIHIYDSGALKAESGTVVFSGENPSYFAKYPEFSKFGTIEVQSGTFNLNYPLTLAQLNIASGAKFSTTNELVISSIENNGIFSITTAELYIKKSLTNNGTFQAGKVYLKPSEKDITITGNSGDTEEIANNTKITELYCENQADKNLVINNSISVEKIALSGIENASGKRLTVKYDKDKYSSGFIYLENNYDEAKYLFLANETLVTIKNATITVCESDTQHISASNFVEKGWRLGDPSEFIWVGKTDDWNEPTNWDYGTVPTPGKPVKIPTGLTNYPVLDSDINLIDETALTKEDSLLVETGAKINFAGQKVSVTNFENLGEVEFNGGSISSTSINNSGTVILTGKEEISGEISESGTVIYSGTETDAKFSWGNNYKNLEIQDGFTGSFENGVIVSDSLEIGNGFEITEKQDNSKNLLEISGIGTLSNKENISITSTGSQSFNGKINLSKILNITSDDKLTIATQSDFTNAGTIKAVGVEIDATGVFTNEGTITSTSGDVDISAKAFDNQSNISANTSFISEATDTFKNSGTIKTESDSTTVTTNSFENAGEILSYLDFVCLDSEIFTNASTITSTSGKVEITTTTFDNQSNISAKTSFTTVATDTFTNAGIITSTSGNVDVSAKAFDNQSNISANTSFISEATDTFINSGTIKTESDSTTVTTNSFENAGEISSYLDFVCSDSVTFTNAGTITSTSGKVDINTKAFDNQSNISANTSFITEATDSFKNSGVITSKTDKIEINAKTFVNKNENLETPAKIKTENGLINVTTTDFENAGEILSYLDFVCLDSEIFTNASTITSTSGKVEITTTTFDNQSNISANTSFIAVATDTFINSGTIKTESDSTTVTTNSFENAGEISSYSDFTCLEPDTFTNAGTITSTSGNVDVSAKAFNNQSNISANTSFISEATDTFINSGTIKTESDSTTVTTNSFENAGEILSYLDFVCLDSEIFTNASTITSTSGKVDINTKAFDNQSNISAKTSFTTVATETFTNSGVITSKTDKIEINAKTFVNKNENLETPAKIKTENGLINVTATDFENAGEISSYSDFTCLEPDTFTNAGTITSTSGKVEITTTTFDNQSNISAKTSFTTVATETFTNSGTISSTAGNIDISAKTFDNQNSISANTDFICEVTDAFTNAGTITSTSGNVDISANSFENAGEISGQIGKLKANEAMTFAENSKTTFESNLEIVAETTFTNAGTITSTSGKVDVSANSFENAGEISGQIGKLKANEAMTFAENSKTTFGSDLEIVAGTTFTNAGTITSTSGKVDVSAKAFDNQSNISANTSFTTVATDTFTNAGTITSTSGNVDVSAKAFDNQSNISANTSFTTVATETFINSGTIKTESDSTTVTTNSFENAGEILSYLDFVCLDSEIFTNASTITSTSGEVEIKTTTFDNQSNISANTDFICEVTDAFTNAGTITSTSGKVDINTKAFDNQSNISANTSFTTEATDSFKNSGVITSKTDKIEINAKTFVNKNENLETPAKIKTENGLINVTTTDFENAGEISSYLDFVCSDSVTFTNAGTITSMDGDAIINAKIIENDGNITAANGKIDIQVELFETTNVIFGKNIDINSKTSIIAGLVKSGAGDINISSDLVITHPVEFCLGGNLFIGTVENQKNLVISSLDENQNATEVKFSQNDDLESSEPNVIVSGYAIVFNGNVSLSANLTVANDFILLNGDTSGENSIYRDSVTGIDGLFAYNLFGRGDFDFIDFSSELPSSIEENNLITNLLSHEKYNSRFSIADGKTISVNKNFYCNGVDLGLNTLSEWILKIPENDVATSAFAELYNASIKNCKVEAITSGEPWLSTENAKDETGNTNVAFSKAILSSPEVSTISDNIIFVKFIDELTGNEIQIENSCNEISAWLENFRFNVSEKISDTNLGIKFSGVYSNLECTESTDGKGDLSSFYLKYEVSADKSTDYRWNTDATGNSYGSDESTDSSGNYKKVIPNIGFERALTVSYAGLRDEHKNRLVSVGTDDAGSNPLFTDTKDAAAPVLIAVSLGQEQHETSAESQHHYDSHNFIEWQFSEPITFDNFPISEDKNENLLATEAFGKISNDETGFTVAGLGTFSSGKISVGSKTNLDEVNAFYRKFALVSGSNGNPASPELKETRIRLSIAGYVDESNPFNINSKSFNNWIGFIKSTETKVPFGNGENPFGTFTMPNTVLSSIKDIVGNYCSKYDSTEKAVGVNEILKSMTEDEKAKTLYGTWDIDPPVVSNYLKEDFKDIYAQEVVAVDYDESHDADGLEIHFLDNKSYMNFDGYNNWVWRTKLGWKENGVYISPKTIPLDTKGGSRMSSNQNQTSGGIRICTLDGFENALNSKNLSSNEINYFNTNFSQKTTYDAFFGETKENIFDVPYLSIKFADSTKSNFLNDNYELSYNVYDSLGNQQGFVTDLAGNLLEDFVVCSPDKNPPKILLSIGGVNKDKLYILFSKIIDWKTNDSPDEAKLRKIVKSLSVFDNSNGTPSDTKLIDYSAGSRARVVTEVEKISTGIEISLTRSVSYEELKNFYIGVNVFDSTSTDLDGDKSLGDPITGFEGDYSMLYDLFENPISADTKHCFSNFAVNAFDVLYAYDGRVESDAVLGQGVYGGNQWTVTDFSGNENNSSQVISNKDISIAGKIRDSSASKENQDIFSMIGDISPNKSKDTYDFEYYTGIPSRLWFSDIVKFFPENQSRTYETDKTMSDSGKIETEIVGNNNQNYTFTLPNEKNDSNGLNWAAGSEIQFLFKVFDSDGNPIMVDVNVDGDISDEVDHPLFALRLKDQEDLTSIDLWSLKIVDILNQKGGATILNNVINSINAEETAIKVDVPKAGNLTVQVLTLDGNVVKVLQRGRVQEGTYYYKWNGTNISGAPVARGMYFIRVVGPNIEETRKVMVIKE